MPLRISQSNSNQSNRPYLNRSRSSGCDYDCKKSSPLASFIKAYKELDHLRGASLEIKEVQGQADFKKTLDRCRSENAVLELGYVICNNIYKMKTRKKISSHSVEFIDELREQLIPDAQGRLSFEEFFYGLSFLIFEHMCGANVAEAFSKQFAHSCENFDLSESDVFGRTFTCLTNQGLVSEGQQEEIIEILCEILHMHSLEKDFSENNLMQRVDRERLIESMALLLTENTLQEKKSALHQSDGRSDLSSSKLELAYTCQNGEEVIRAEIFAASKNQDWHFIEQGRVFTDPNESSGRLIKFSRAMRDYPRNSRVKVELSSGCFQLFEINNSPT